MTDDIITLLNNVDESSISDTHICTPEQSSKILRNTTHYIKTYCQNIRSINCHFLDLEVFLSRFSFELELLVLTECWLSCAKNYQIPEINGYSSYKTTKHVNQSDGVVVYVKTFLNPIVEELDLNASASGLLIKTKYDTAILCIYRSPSTENIDKFLDAFNAILPTLRKFQSVVLTGDFNINIKSPLDLRSQNYLNCLAFHGFLPTHTLPTRGNNCLDHTFVRTKCHVTTLIFESTITDHYSSLACVKIKKARALEVSIVSKIDYESLDSIFKSLDFTNILSIEDPNTATDELVILLSKVIEENTVKIKRSARKRTLKPWITTGLLRCIRNRDALHKKVKLCPNNETLKITYKRYRNFCTKILKKAKRQYDTDLLKKSCNNTKALWNAIETITYTSKSRHSSTQLIQQSHSPIYSCNNVNSFFVNIGKELADKSKMHSSQQLIKTFSHTNTTLSSFVLEETDNDEILKTINSLRSNASTGWDGISSTILKRYSAALTPVLCHIFNRCFQASVFPSSLKKAIIHPIFKGGNGNQVNNYRPIAVLSALSKVLEHLVNKRLRHYLEHFNLISKQQFGFRKNKSTAEAVHELTTFIVTNLNNKKKVLTVFLDLAKAFDTVPITILLQKLENIGVRGQQLQFFQSYLTGRTQMVKIGNHVSDELHIQYGVPQGSILGPTLFLVFINDLCNLNIPNSKIVTYADDTAITFYDDSWSNIQRVAQNGITFILNWLRFHTLTLNTDKTKFITFSSKLTSQPKNPITLIAHSCFTQMEDNCHCSKIASVNNIKYLGIILDKTLNFRAHVEALTGRIRKLIFIFKTLRYVANQFIIRNVYYALGQSILSYCICCWGGASKTVMLPLEIAQRAILKVATFRPILYSTTQLYKDCKVLSVRQLFVLHTILLQHKNTPYVKITKRRTDNICPLPVIRYSFSKKFFFYLGPFLYNKINTSTSIYKLSVHECKATIRSFLHSKTYEETELFLQTLL